MYEELIQLNKIKKVSFANVVTFNMNEYVELDEKHPMSCHSFMWTKFFKHVNIRKANVNILNGNAEDLGSECKRYEEKIKKYGGFELFISDIGSDGHIAFNEPGSSLASRTRIKTLTTESIITESKFFDNDIDRVPKTVLTVGIGTVMDARMVLIFTGGRDKARALHEAIESGVNHIWTLSCLQLHPHGIIVCDDASTEEMKVGTVNYFKSIEKDNLDPNKILK